MWSLVRSPGIGPLLRAPRYRSSSGLLVRYRWFLWGGVKFYGEKYQCLHRLSRGYRMPFSFPLHKRHAEYRGDRKLNITCNRLTTNGSSLEDPRIRSAIRDLIWSTAACRFERKWRSLGGFSCMIKSGLFSRRTSNITMKSTALLESGRKCGTTTKSESEGKRV